jgi:hypothetical protein
MKFNFFLERIILFIYKKIILYHDFFKNLFYSTYSYKKKKISSKILNYLKKDDFPNIQVIKRKNINEYLLHNFNLLGSNKSNLDLKKKMKINFRNKLVSEKIRKNLDYHYKPLDWQRDFKSNYRWDEKKLSKKIKFLDIPKTDVKIPWEFARMQHIPQLAIYASKIKKKNFVSAQNIFEEFQNQLVDFISSNPPEYGVNWICTMDVSIRISNLLIAKDIFNTSGFYLKPEINNIFESSVKDHKDFILKNLEYSSYRGNHYISNICGLAVIARYLPENSYSNSLIAFVSQELNNEIFFQFNNDGSTKEGSTSYHKFSMEMIFYATSIILSFGDKRFKNIKKKLKPELLKINKISPKLKKNFILYKAPKKLFDKSFISPFPEKYFKKMSSISHFFLNIYDQNNQIIQIGDNDSGKFFNFTPDYYNQKINNINKINYFENRESIKYILSLIEAWGLISRSKNSINFEYYFVKTLLGKINFKKKIIFNKGKAINKKKNLENINKFNKIKKKILQTNKLNAHKYTIPIKSYKKNKLNFFEYRDFGIYIWKNDKYFFSFRLIREYDKKFTSHYHFDQFSNILFIDKKFFISDPGTYCYSSNKFFRNYMRSYKAHFTPIDINLKSDTDIFAKIDFPYPEVILLNRYCYLVKAKINEQTYYAGFINKGNKFELYHFTKKKQKKLKINIYNSPGYGLLISNKL